MADLDPRIEIVEEITYVDIVEDKTTVEVVEEITEVIEIATQGPRGVTGATGAPGPGVPMGGTTGQVLAKLSDANRDTGWVSAGVGDMMKSTYDTDGDGKVDSAEVADSVPWSGVTGKPTTYPPSSHGNTEHIEAYITSSGVTYEALNANGDVGTTSGTICAGDDSRLSDARTPTAHAGSHVNGTDDIPSATSSQKGLMTAEYASKLDGIAEGANNYTLPTATADTLGGVKVGSGLAIVEGVLSTTGSGGLTEEQIKAIAKKQALLFG